MTQLVRLLAVIIVGTLVTVPWVTPASAQGTATSPDESTSERQGDSAGESNSSDTRQPSEAGDQGRTVALKPLMEKAATNSDLVAEYKAQREAAEWKKYQAKWARAPKIKSTTTLAPVPANADPSNLRENYSEIGALEIGPLISESLQVIVPIYTFGRIKIAKQLADIGVDVTKLKRAAAVEDVLFQTKRAFYGLQLSRTFAPILEKGNKLIQEKLQEMETARDFGDKDFSIDDFRRLQIFATEVESRMADNQKLREISSSGLQFLAELETEQLTAKPLDSDAEPKKLKDLETYWQYARTHRSDLRQLRKAVKARELQTKLERRNYYPNIAFFSGLGYSWSTEETASQPVFCRDSSGPCPSSIDNLYAEPDTDPLDTFSIRLGVAINWDIDPLNQYGQVQAIDAKLRKLKAQESRANRAVRLDIEKKYTDAKDALERIEILNRRLDAAESWRDQVGFKMEAAGIEFGEDDIKPIREFYQAKAEYLRARTEYRVARAALAQAIGIRWLEDVGQSSSDATIDAPQKGAARSAGGEVQPPPESTSNE
jgi:outer membrane protein TolC